MTAHMPRRTWAQALAIACLCIFSGCAAPRSEATRMPSGNLATMSFDQLEAELRRGEAEMRAAGLTPVATVAIANPTTAQAGPDNATSADGAVANNYGDGDAGSEVADSSTSQPTEPSPPMDAPAAPEPEPPMEAEAAEGQGGGVLGGAKARREQRRHREQQCTQICDLAETMCGLETRICDLASQHRDQPRYAQVCAQAQGDCARAKEACHAC